LELRAEEQAQSDRSSGEAERTPTGAPSVWASELAVDLLLLWRSWLGGSWPDTEKTGAGSAACCFGFAALQLEHKKLLRVGSSQRK